MISNQKYLFSKESKSSNTIVKINGVEIGNKGPVIIAGPCTINEKMNLIEFAAQLKEIGVDILRGGTFKPRTSPYSFQGLENKGLDLLIQAKKKVGIPIITEITSLEHLNKYIDEIDIIQVGSRNMYNYELLKALGKTTKPVLLKRGLSSTYQEWLLAAEYLLAGGNPNVILCERGIRTFETETRNTLDLQAIPYIKKHSHLPIIIDPSHASGNSYMVNPMSKAAIASGADGLMIEVEANIDEAICDKEQLLDLKAIKELINEIKKDI